MPNAPFYLAIGTDQHGAARLWASGDTRAEAVAKMAESRRQYRLTRKGRQWPYTRITVEVKAVSSDSR